MAFTLSTEIMPSLKSMTAYARDEQTIGATRLIWELRSVNHRYLDGHFHLPDTQRIHEQSLKARLAQRLSRGRVDVNLNVVVQSKGELAHKIDQAVLGEWSVLQDEIHAVIPNAAPLSVMELIKDGEVLVQNTPDEGLDESALLAGFDQALAGLLANRSAEGGRLQGVLAEKLDGIESITKTLIEKMPEYTKAHQVNWQTKLKKFQNDELDPVRLHQEAALLIAKADVMEELDRLESHISEFTQAMQSKKPAGRRLDFLLQEFNREANTLGSKSIHKDITNASVEMKVLIDQLREQVQNIE